MNLPDDFIIRTKPLLGNEWDEFYSALNEESPVSIRINNGKLADKVYNPSDNVSWWDAGYYLKERPQFTFDPLFHAGCYYVQESSSMFIGQIFKQYGSNNIRVLDLCAAPGGKSTLIADAIDENSLLVSNEIIRSRANILAENMAKWGKANIIVTNNYSAQLGRIRGFFDIILVDAPCSGEGMFRKDKGAIEEWSVDNVRLCKERQQRILADIWPSLKEGGILIYSTCTYNLEENEENVKWICDELGAETLPVVTNDEWNISPSWKDDVKAYRFLPHRTKGEGFFCSVLRKQENEKNGLFRKKKDEKVHKNKLNLSIEYKEYIHDKEKFIFYNKKDLWCAFPESLYNELSILSSLNIISEGICIGEFKGKDFIPTQSLALNDKLNKEAFIRHEVDWETAIAYLRKETLILSEQQKGYILLTYNNMPIGFVKNIGNRANNLYPQEWRIRSSHVPETEVRVL